MRRRSADRAFKADADQFLGLDGEFHREFLHHFLAEAVDDQRHGVFLADAALKAIEKLVLGDPRGCRLMLDLRARIARDDVGNGMRPAFVADEKRIALGEVPRILGRRLHMDKTSVAVL